MRIVTAGSLVAASCIGVLASPLAAGAVKIKGKVQYARVTEEGKSDNLPHKDVKVAVDKTNAPTATWGPATSGATGSYEVGFNAANAEHSLEVFDKWTRKPLKLAAADANKGATREVDLVSALCPCAAVGSGWTLIETFKDAKNGNAIRTECTNGNQYGDFAFTFKKNGAAKAQAIGKCVFVKGQNGQDTLDKALAPVDKEIAFIMQVCSDPKATTDWKQVHQVVNIFDIAKGELKIIRRTRDGQDADGDWKHKDWGGAKTITKAKYTELEEGANSLDKTLELISTLSFDGDEVTGSGFSGEEEDTTTVLARHGLVRHGVEPVIRWFVSGAEPVLEPGDMIVLSDLLVEDIVELDDRFMASMDAEGLILTALEPVAPADGDALLTFSAGVAAEPWQSTYVVICPGATEFWSSAFETGTLPDGVLPEFASTAGMINLEAAGACPPGAVQEHDGCGDDAPDANGGCGVDPAELQFAGEASLGAPVRICGTVGTFGASFRDLDWYAFSLTAPSRVRVSMQHQDGAGAPLPNATMFIMNGTDCATSITEYAGASAASPFVSDEVALPAGEHTVIFTVGSYGPDGPPCPSAYVGVIEVTELLPAACGAANECADESAGPGCSDLVCCADVCAVQQSCCETAWDALCAEMAVGLCDIFVYDCPPMGGAPVNDCATGASGAGFDTVYAFDTTNAGTDGPPDEACDQARDIWYVVQVEHDGELEVEVSSPLFDSTIGMYSLGPQASFDPSDLPALHLGCVDIQGAGGEVATLVSASGGEFYLIRVAGYAGESGSGTVVFRHARTIFDTGNTFPVNYDATGGGNFTLMNLGWSSGNLSAANPQRWTAQAFSAPAPGPGMGWRLSAIHAYGFTPSGAINDSLNFRIWTRSGVANPNGETLVAAGSVEFPVPHDIVGGAMSEDHEMDLSAMELDLEPGDYWLTIFADAFSAPAVPANFAWYTNAQEGIPNLDPVTQAPRMWRSQMMPAPGFLVYTLSAGTLQQQGRLDSSKVYNAGFRILGQEVAMSTCMGDLNGSWTVDGADLGFVLASWCPVGPCPPGASDLNADGSVNGADLGILLANWGPCQ